MRCPLVVWLRYVIRQRRDGLSIYESILSKDVNTISSEEKVLKVPKKVQRHQD